MVDKIVALGLIDVRDIEEVGTGPLMEELGMEEEFAQRIVDRCAEEAKVVAVEQEAKKAADARAKAADRALLDAGTKGVDGVAFANPLLPQNAEAAVRADDSALDGEPDRMRGALEATEGGAPEIITHDSSSIAAEGELSPEEEAIHPVSGVQSQGERERKDLNDETEDAAALAEGRVDPPAPASNEPVSQVQPDDQA
jgi:hypothetical protein